MISNWKLRRKGVRMCQRGAYINLVPLTRVNGGTAGKPLKHSVVERYVDDMTPTVAVRSVPLVL